MRSISALKQRDLTVTTYYTKLKTLLDGLQVLEPCLKCKYEVKHQYTERKITHNMIKFVNGLNSDYEYNRSK